MRKWLLIVALVAGFVLLCSLLFSQYDGGYGSYTTVSGDVNGDGAICMDDSIQIIWHLWIDGRTLPCPDAADVDRSGVVDVNDVILGLRHVFYGEVIPDCPVTCN